MKDKVAIAVNSPATRWSRLAIMTMFVGFGSGALMSATLLILGIQHTWDEDAMDLVAKVVLIPCAIELALGIATVVHFFMTEAKLRGLWAVAVGVVLTLFWPVLAVMAMGGRIPGWWMP